MEKLRRYMWRNVRKGIMKKIYLKTKYYKINNSENLNSHDGQKSLFNPNLSAGRVFLPPAVFPLITKKR